MGNIAKYLKNKIGIEDDVPTPKSDQDKLMEAFLRLKEFENELQRPAERYAKILLENMSSERLDYHSFAEQVVDHIENQENYDLDPQSIYYKALSFAYSQIVDKDMVPEWGERSVEESEIFKNYVKRGKDYPQSVREVRTFLTEQLHELPVGTVLDLYYKSGWSETPISDVVLVSKIPPKKILTDFQIGELVKEIEPDDAYIGIYRIYKKPNNRMRYILQDKHHFGTHLREGSDSYFITRYKLPIEKLIPGEG